LYVGLTGEGFKYVFCLSNGELEFVSRRAMRSCKATDYLVKASSEVLQDITNDNLDVITDVALDNELIAYLTGLRIGFDNDGTRITIRAKNSTDLAFQVTEVLFGPFNL
jgi:hypothetical protein